MTISENFTLGIYVWYRKEILINVMESTHVLYMFPGGKTSICYSRVNYKETTKIQIGSVKVLSRDLGMVKKTSKLSHEVLDVTLKL